jgi:tRNA nucleotidyltransferase (CCA-adding enzyme)
MGQWTGLVLARVVEWQLEHPAGTKDESADWLRAEKAAGRLQTEDAAGTGQPKRGKNNDGAAKKAKR